MSSGLPDPDPLTNAAKKNLTELVIEWSVRQRRHEQTVSGILNVHQELVNLETDFRQMEQSIAPGNNISNSTEIDEAQVAALQIQQQLEANGILVTVNKSS